jgi:hypothetical protein
MKLKDKVVLITGGGSGLGARPACCSRAKVPRLGSTTCGLRLLKTLPPKSTVQAESRVHSLLTFPVAQPSKRCFPIFLLHSVPLTF